MTTQRDQPPSEHSSDGQAGSGKRAPSFIREEPPKIDISSPSESEEKIFSACWRKRALSIIKLLNTFAEIYELIKNIMHHHH